RRLPIKNRFSHPRFPLLRRGWIHVINDRRHWLRQRGVGVLFLQSPTSDVRAIRRSLLGGSKIHLADREKAHALVPSTRHHRILGQPHETPVCEDTLRQLRASCLAAATTTARGWRRGRRPGLCRLNLHVVGER